MNAMTIPDWLGWLCWGILALAGAALIVDAIRHDIEERRRHRAKRERDEPNLTVSSLTGRPAMKRANAYANAMVKRGQIARHEGRPEHDMTTHGTPLKPGS